MIEEWEKVLEKEIEYLQFCLIQELQSISSFSSFPKPEFQFEKNVKQDKKRFEANNNFDILNTSNKSLTPTNRLLTPMRAKQDTNGLNDLENINEVGNNLFQTSGNTLNSEKK